MANEDEDKLLEALLKLRAIKRHLVDDLGNLRARMVDLSESVKAAKTVGASVGAVGTVAAVSGIVLAFFTAGASLALTATAIGGGVVGGVINVTASIAEHKEYKEYMERIDRLLRKYAEEERKVNIIVENYVRVACQKAKDCDLDEDSYVSSKATSKLLGAAFNVVQVGFTVFEIADLVKNWNAQHPTLDTVEALMENIKADIKILDKEIEELKRSGARGAS